MKKSLLLTFILLAMTVWVGAKIVSAASDNSNKPDSPPGQAKKEDNSQGNQGNQDNNNPPGQQNKPEDTGRGTGDHKITICHLPPGNPANAQSIEIDKSAWETGHSPHNSHALDFIIDGSHPCPPKNNPGGGDNNNNPGGSNNNNNGNGGTGGSSTSHKEKFWEQRPWRRRDQPKLNW